MNRPGVVIICLVFCAFLAVFPPIAGGEDLLGFARSLFDEGDWQRAITEAKRFVFTQPDSPQLNQARLLIARAHLALGEREEASRIFIQLAAQRQDPELAALSLFELGRLTEAASLARGEAFWSALAANPPPGLPEPEKIRARAWLNLGLARMRLGRFDEARQAFLQAGASGQTLAEAAARGDGLNLRSPAAAGALSALVPGLGQLYVGRGVDAAISLGLNSVLLWGALDAAAHDSWGVFTALFLAECVAYGGNIYNAVNGAHRHNEKLKKEFIRQALEGVRLGLVPMSGRGLALTLTLEY